MDQNTPAPAPAPAPVSTVAAAAPGTTMYAGFWKRFAAFFLDGIIISVVSAPFTGLLGGDSKGASNAGSGISFIIGLVYAVAMLSSSWQATIGKKALGIKVTTEDGGRLDVSKAVIRELSKIISGIILLIGYLMMLGSPKKQTLHDKIAKTVVVIAN